MKLFSGVSEYDEDRFALRFEERGLGPGRPVKAFNKTFLRDHSVRLHYHQSLELNINTGLSGKAWIDGREYSLSAELVLLLPPRSIHSYAIHACPGSMTIIHISPAALEPWINVAGLQDLFARLPPTSPSYVDALPAIHNLVSELPLIESHLPDDSASFNLAARVLELAARLAEADHGPPSSDRELRKLIDWTEARLAQAPTLEEAATFSSMSRSAFCRWFKIRTGAGYASYLEELRLDAAREHLAAGMPVARAAEAVGYEDPSYFVRRFRGRFGKTPGRWAKEYRLPSGERLGGPPKSGIQIDKRSTGLHTGEQ
jgi:AraC-like DNA-binding protein